MSRMLHMTPSIVRDLDQNKERQVREELADLYVDSDEFRKKKADFSKVRAAINKYLNVEGKFFNQLEVSQKDSPLHYELDEHWDLSHV